MKARRFGTIAKKLPWSRRSLIVALTVCAFIVPGIVLLQRSQAEPFSLMQQAESGQIQGDAIVTAVAEADITTSTTAVTFGPSTGNDGGDNGGDPGGNDGGDNGGDTGGDDGGGEPQEGTGPTGSGALWNRGSAHCLDNDAAKTTVGNKIQLYDCFMSNAQKWTFKRIDGKAYSLLQVQGMCIHVTSPVDNADVRLADCDPNSDNQQWKWKEDKYIANASNDRGLVPAFGAVKNGTNIVVSNCNGTNAQTWRMMDQEDALPPTGTFKHSSGRCLDNAQSKTVQGNLIQLWDCNGTAAQKYTLLPVNGALFNMKVQGWCIESFIPGPTNTTGNAKVILGACDTRDTQKWEKGTNGSIVNKGSARCLVPSFGGTSNGTEIMVSNCNGSDSQKWSTPKLTKEQ